MLADVAETHYDFDARYRELEELGREIERLRQQVPQSPDAASRIEAMTAEAEAGWHDLAQEILKREG